MSDDDLRAEARRLWRELARVVGEGNPIDAIEAALRRAEQRGRDAAWPAVREAALAEGRVEALREALDTWSKPIERGEARQYGIADVTAWLRKRAEEVERGDTG